MLSLHNMMAVNDHKKHANGLIEQNLKQNGTKGQLAGASGELKQPPVLPNKVSLLENESSITMQRFAGEDYGFNQRGNANNTTTIIHDDNNLS